MSALSAVHAVLAADAGVTAAVGARLFPIELPQAPILPALVLTLVDEQDGRHLMGSNRYPVARIIVDCVAATHQAADALGDAVAFAMVDYRGTVAGFEIDDFGHDDLDFFDKGQSGTHWRRRLEFSMRYRLAA